MTPHATASLFTEQDRRQITGHGLSVERILAQLATFRRGISNARLVRPGTVGEGIRTLAEDRLDHYRSTFHAARREGRMTKFVPASGAATRMFRDLSAGYTALCEGQAPDDAVTRFVDELDAMPFVEALRGHLARQDRALDGLVNAGEYREVLAALLEEPPDGMGYATLPKGLIPFHRYPEGTRTAFHEHLVEAANTIGDGRGRSTLHFTVGKAHLEAIRSHLETAMNEGPLAGHTFAIGYSFQKPSTDTIAVDLDNLPFRDDDGNLVFRPGGHGALLSNLDDMNGDIVFIKNIDNVVPDRLKPVSDDYKILLGGFLVDLQEQVFEFLRLLRAGAHNRLPEIEQFVEEQLSVRLPAAAINGSPETRRRFLIDRLNRPLRVCGMVRNQGEPGGGPFWVSGGDGEATLQIVESSQVNLDDPDQAAIWNASTHFNPVDLVCGMRDVEGQPFDLEAFADAEGGIITRKSMFGRELKALELPGLWNGGMANWNTVFVEVPIDTFNPVKTVFDLLRPEHQPA